MNKIFQHREFAVCYLLQFIRQVALLDLNSSQIKLLLFLFRVSDKESFNCPDCYAIMCGFTGNKEIVFLREKNCFFYQDINLNHVYRKFKI